MFHWYGKTIRELFFKKAYASFVIIKERKYPLYEDGADLEDERWYDPCETRGVGGGE